MSEKKATSTKVLQRLNKRSARAGQKDDNEFKKLKNQYNVIREDVLKLRADLQKGYDMARGMVERKSVLKDFLKAK